SRGARGPFLSRRRPVLVATVASWALVTWLPWPVAVSVGNLGVIPDPVSAGVLMGPKTLGCVIFPGCEGVPRLVNRGRLGVVDRSEWRCGLGDGEAVSCARRRRP